MEYSVTPQNDVSEVELKTALESLKRHLFSSSSRKQQAVVHTPHNSYDVTQFQKLRLNSAHESSQILKMSFKSQNNDTVVVFRTFSKPINGLAAFKSAKTAEKTFGKLHSYALFDIKATSTH